MELWVWWFPPFFFFLLRLFSLETKRFRMADLGTTTWRARRPRWNAAERKDETDPPCYLLASVVRPESYILLDWWQVPLSRSIHGRDMADQEPLRCCIGACFLFFCCVVARFSNSMSWVRGRHVEEHALREAVFRIDGMGKERAL